MPTLKLGSTTALTESSGTLTINVANPTVTLGSNATFNAPNLGTPSAVTLTNATFPAGHVLHVQQNVISGSSANQAFTSTNEGTWYASGNSITISSANAALGSKILIIYEHMFGVNPGSSSQQLTYKIKRTAPSVSDNLGFRLYDGLQTNTNGYYRFSASGSIIDESLGSGDHTYALEFTISHHTQGSTVYYNWYSDSGGTGKNRMIAMVIK